MNKNTIKVYIIFITIPSTYSYSGTVNELDCVFLNKEKAEDYIKTKNTKQNTYEHINYFIEEHLVNE